MKEIKKVIGAMDAVREAAKKAVEGMTFKDTAEARHQMVIEDRIASFKNFVGTYTDQDIEEFSRIPVDKMRDILRFLACGYKLEDIKTYTIWRQHQTK